MSAKCPLCQTRSGDINLDYHCPHCGHFQMTPGFISYLHLLQARYSNEVYQQVLAVIREEIKKSPTVITFVEDFDRYAEYFPRLLDIDDVCSRIGLDIIGNSRGSDYGD